MLKKKKFPSIKECYTILDKHKAPNLVIKHSESVAKCCYLIGKKMTDNGENINLNLIVSAALLHDIFKTIEIDDYYKYQSKTEVNRKKAYWDSLKKRFNGKSHEDAFEIEFKKRYPALTKIAVNHKYSQINQGFNSKEEEILYYSDKLVKFDKITTLKERLDDGKKRYSHKFKSKKDYEFIEKTNKKIFSLEKQIFKITGLSQNDLIKLNMISLKKLVGKDKIISGE